MDLSVVIPAVVALGGIPLTYVLTTRREDRLRREQWEREDQIYSKSQQEWINQQWWQRKADAYSETLRALAREIQLDLEYLAEMEEGRANEKLRARLSEDLHERRLALTDLAALGGFVVSAEASAAIAAYLKLINDLYWEDDPYDQVCSDLKGARECLARVQSEAERDLKIEHVTLASTPPSPPQGDSDPRPVAA